MMSFELQRQSNSHKNRITGIEWVSADRFATTSLDHTLRIHEAERLTETFHLDFNDSFPTSLAVSPKLERIFVGHEDGYIRMFDDRAKSKQASKLFKSHTKWISSIKLNPTNDNLFTSVNFL